MKSLLTCMLLLGLSADALHAIEPAPAENAATTATARSAADTDYDAVWAIYNVEPPAGLEFPSKEYFLWQDQKLKEFAVAVHAFGEKYPNDPRRYEGWVQVSYTGPSFILDFKPAFAETPKEENLVTDRAAVAAFRSKQVELLQQVVAADDATDRQRYGGFFALLIDVGMVARAKGEPADFTALRPLVDRVIAKFPDERAVPVIEMYAERLRQQSATAADAFAAELKANPMIAAALEKAHAAWKAEREKRAEAQKVQAAEIATIKFTAADGREVDVAQLKGKVVLVDFWATWCGPCIAELPNVKKVYAAYHDKGFEVIGITLENPNTRPTDTPEQRAAKLEAAKQKMLDFVAKNEMPWPQYFDGKWWKNDYVVRFGIEAIPAMFLLDKDGRIAATDVRGEKLEAEVKRLLGL